MTDQFPSDVESEKLLLGAIIVSNRLLIQAQSELLPDDFYSSTNRQLFVNMIEMEAEQVEINPLTLRDHAKAKTETCDLVYVSNLMTDRSAGMFTSLHSLINILKERSLARRIIKTADSIRARGIDGDDPGELLTDAEESFAELRKYVGFAGKGFKHISEIGKDASEQYERLRRGDSAAIPTTYPALDSATRGGIHPGDMWVIASLTGRGKSSWALGAARRQGMNGIPVGFVSREMSEIENFQRMHSAMSNVPLWKIKPGMWPDTFQTLAEWQSAVDELPIWFNCSTGNVFEMRSQVKDLVRTQGIKALFVDYLQLMGVAAETKNTTTRAQEIATVSRVLKEIAMENKIGVFALAQFNRMAAHNDRPEIHHLAESSGIEKDASLVLILDMPEQVEGQVNRDCTMRIAKHRNGPQLSLAYTYRGDVLTFEEAAA